MSGKAVRALYRSFWRTIQGLQWQGVDVLDIRTPLNKDAWMFQGGSHGWGPPRGDFHLAALKALVPWAAEGATSGSLTPADLRQLVRRAFRRPPEGSSPGEQLDRGFESLRQLAAQIHMHECSSSCETQGVHVEVTSAYVGPQEQLDPTYEAEEGVPQKQYFTYRIRVSNCSSDTVQLLGRHWVILGPGGEVVTEVPKGSRGVVGCTPLLEPGACFEYYSGADLEGGAGSMHGSFQMATVDPERPTQHLRTFDALVGPFLFKRPGPS